MTTTMMTRLVSIMVKEFLQLYVPVLKHSLAQNMPQQQAQNNISCYYQYFL